jgi:hypothetical protein
MRSGSHLARSINVYSTLKTTEDTVKSGGLAKTTLERLAAFRYLEDLPTKPPAPSNNPKPVTARLHEMCEIKNIAVDDGIRGHFHKSLCGLEVHDNANHTDGSQVDQYFESFLCSESSNLSVSKHLPLPLLRTQTFSILPVSEHTESQFKATNALQNTTLSLSPLNLTVDIQSFENGTPENVFDDSFADGDFEVLFEAGVQELLIPSLTTDCPTVKPTEPVKIFLSGDDSLDLDADDEFEMIQLLDTNVASPSFHRPNRAQTASNEPQNSLPSPPSTSSIISQSSCHSNGHPVQTVFQAIPEIIPTPKGGVFQFDSSKVTPLFGLHGLFSHFDKGVEYHPIPPFARPDFPSRVRDRSPIIGISSSSVLRTCFRIGEAIRAGSFCNSHNQDAVIELFARITSSTRESGTTRQHFQFADLFNDRPPFPKGILENYKIHALQETESRMLLDIDTPGRMVRCLGRVRRELPSKSWMIQIINIRPTDWEEVRWTKEISEQGK